jgi:hypothetical protein
MFAARYGLDLYVQRGLVLVFKGLISKMRLGQIDCEEGRWMELVQDLFPK